MSKEVYNIRINCVGFHDYAIMAKNKKDALDEAVKMFQCESTEGELCEFLDKDSSMADEVHQVYYPDDRNVA